MPSSEPLPPLAESKKNPSLKPQRSIVCVGSLKVDLLNSDEISPDRVGHKAYGLCCLPTPWTPNFFVIDKGLLAEARQLDSMRRAALVEEWTPRLIYAAGIADITGAMPIFVRSSATSETMAERGRLHSCSGSIDQLSETILACIKKICDDSDLIDFSVHFIVQVAVSPEAAKGHLSNERLVYEEARDWLGTFEPRASSPIGESFTVNLRRWRKQVSELTERSPIACNLRAQISQVMHVPAWWAYRKSVRLHFEWVWDGRHIWLVQADEAEDIDGVDPMTLAKPLRESGTQHEFNCLEDITEAHAERFHKIRNVLTYFKLGLPITRLVVLQDPLIFSEIRTGEFPAKLVQDIEWLVAGSLIIRTDLATDNKDKRQLLPRTCELRSLEAVKPWLKKTLLSLADGGITEDIAFIFHNFVPAVSAAFAYAIPGQRKVRIEALWGIPEGLYYNSHDKIEVDTGSWRSDTSATPPDALPIVRRPRYKRYFISPDAAGAFVVKSVGSPYDWRLSIPKEEWIRQIAWDSRRIAEHDGTSVSIMWFVGVPPSAAQKPVLPWFHEPLEYIPASKPSAGARRKTPFDEELVIRRASDIEALQEQAKLTSSRVRQIRIQPSEEKLLRDKDLLRKIGALAKAINAVILLEGGTLSHAYYQLVGTAAVVEVAHPFEEVEDRREFNKLVRDAIPRKIASGGEIVHLSRLTGDSLLRALREKLVEEALEALDAKSQQSIVEELADVEEVIDGILRQLGTSRHQLKKQQSLKREKAGAFREGYVLLDTINPPPRSAQSEQESLTFGSLDKDKAEQDIIERPLAELSQQKISSWSDQRLVGSADERILSITVPLLLESWTADSREIPLGEDRAEIVRARIVGNRTGNELQLEVSVFSPPRQLPLF
jgi:predicted house-cleaning noncanonical NTP pyrophosphatase (MazG superfamily)